jgi:ribosome-associated protein
VIGSGTSERQMRSVLHHIEDLGKQTGYPAFRISADDRAVWLLADFVDVVVHLFEPDARQHYDLEMLWGDAPRVAWDNKPAGTTEPDSDNSGLDGDERTG